MTLFGFEAIPPEEVKRRHDLFHMQQQDSAHQVLDLIGALTEEQLDVVSRLMKHSRESKFMHGYYQAMIAIAEYDRFGVCVCGLKHDDTIPTPEGEPVSHEKQDYKSNRKPKGCTCSDERFGLNGCICGVDIENFRLKMMEYNLELEEESDTLKCSNCKLVYVSLADRVLRAPGKEGCEGCVHQEKWG